MRRVLIALFVVVLGLLAGPSPAFAGGGSSGPEICRVEQGGRLASDGSTMYTFHQGLCLRPDATRISVSSKTFRNGAQVATRAARTCAADSYRGVCKGSDSMVVTRNHSDVLCIQTRIDWYIAQTGAKATDLDTSCWTRGARAATYANLTPLDVGVGCDPATLLYRENGQVKSRHLATCSDKVDAVTLSTVLSRNSSYNQIVQQTPYRQKDCSQSSPARFSCTSTTGIADRSSNDLYCSVSEAQWKYRSTNVTARDFGKACWYF